MKTSIIILFLIKITTQEKTIQIVGNPLAHAHPCEGNSDVLASFETGLPPGEENQYSLRIKEDIIPHFQFDLKFDSDASITLSDPEVARITAYPEIGLFNIGFFKSAKSLGVKVKGPETGTIPYVKSILINQQEICEKPNSGYFDGLIIGYKGTAEINHDEPDDSCGRRKVVHTELIVNGQPTSPGDWPWHVALYRLEGQSVAYICGGTLLSKSLVLTAAHCATIRGVPVVPQTLNVVLGKYNLIGGDIAPQEREVFEVIVHPSFGPKTLDNDIALLKLKSEAIFDDYVQPACLWNKNSYKKLPGKVVYGTVVGWGFNNKDELSSTLQQVSMPKVSEATCLKSNPVFFSKALNFNKFCAGYKNGTSVCNGDSGGGFQVFIPDTAGDKTRSGTWHVRGIVSTTLRRTDAPICDPNQFVLFTDVAKYTNWIKEYLKA